MADAILTNPVGVNQPNNPQDLVLVRGLLNRFISLGQLPGIAQLPAEGAWDAALAAALKAVEGKYFFGMADPDRALENGDTLFEFLAATDLAHQQIAATLSAEVYQLAAVMVPGGADWTKRTVIKRPVIVDRKSVIKTDVKLEPVQGNIRTYLPDILKALRDVGLNDTDMLMMALGTIRAETSRFEPIDEGVSQFNTSPVGTKGRHAFDLYDTRTDLGNKTAPDGAMYKGRGFVQLTGRSNYKSIGDKIQINLENDPNRANEPDVAAKVLAHFLRNKETAIRQALANDNQALARRLVNGGSHGLADFKQSFQAGRKYLGIVVPQKAVAIAKKSAAKRSTVPPKTVAATVAKQ